MHWWTSSNPIGLLFDNIWNVERAQRDYITLDALGMLMLVCCCYCCCVVVVGNCFSLSLINIIIIIMIRTCVNIIRFHNSLVMLTIHSKKGWFAAVVVWITNTICSKKYWVDFCCDKQSMVDQKMNWGVQTSQKIENVLKNYKKNTSKKIFFSIFQNFFIYFLIVHFQVK